MSVRLRFHVSLATSIVVTGWTFGPSILWHPSIALAAFAALTFASWIFCDELAEVRS